jgi:hypothetical protein
LGEAEVGAEFGDAAPHVLRHPLGVLPAHAATVGRWLLRKH